MEPELLERPGYIALTYELDVQPGEELMVEKIVALFTSRDAGISEPGEEACDWVMHVAGDFDELLDRHVVSLAAPLGPHPHRARPRTDGLVQMLHLQLFHLLQTVSNNSVGLDVGVPARGLHGEAYRGHIFWDELFIFPFLSLRFPQLARALLLYRYRRIDQARQSCDRCRTCRSDVPVAEREQRPRSDADDASQPGVGSLAARRVAPAAPRRRGHRLQRCGSTTRPPATSSSCASSARR